MTLTVPILMMVVGAAAQFASSAVLANLGRSLFLAGAIAVALTFAHYRLWP